ncbi:MAG: L-dopachrome tautomerase-related protein [Phycisphaerales bacterium]
MRPATAERARWREFGAMLACIAGCGAWAAGPAIQPEKSAKPAAPSASQPAKAQSPAASGAVEVDVVAEIPQRQLTGVAITKKGRMFISFPRWHTSFKMSLIEQFADGMSVPYPNIVWNSYSEGSEEHRGIQFVCVQSIKVDDADRLWVLDSAAPRMEGVKRGEFDGGGPKLIEFDLETARQRRVYRILGLSALESSYLNDFEVDNANNIAYITDSGDGAIILVNLRTYESKRVLERHASTKPDPTFIPIIDGQELRNRKGVVPSVGADGIALDRANGYLYYQPLIGKKLYRIKTQVLLDVLPGKFMTGEQKNTVAAAVEEVGETVMTDGMIFDHAGNLYFTAVERNAITMRTPDGELHDIVTGGLLKWPDSLAIGPKFGGSPDGSDQQYMYITASQVHLSSWFSADGSEPTEPFRVLRIKMPTTK